jgi:hypothetical protein
MANKQEMLEQLKAARASGVLEVEFGGPPSKRVRYRSDAELTAAINALEEEVSPKVKTVVVRPLSMKGW